MSSGGEEKEKKFINIVIDGLGKGLTIVGVSKVLDEPEALAEASKDGELALEGIRAEKEIEHALVLRLARLPVRVRHRYLVEIWMGEGEGERGRKLIIVIFLGVLSKVCFIQPFRGFPCPLKELWAEYSHTNHFFYLDCR